MKKILAILVLFCLVISIGFSVFLNKKFVDIYAYLSENSEVLSGFSLLLINQASIDGMWISYDRKKVIIKHHSGGGDFLLAKNNSGLYEVSSASRCIEIITYESASSESEMRRPVKTFSDFSKIHGISLKDINFYLNMLQENNISGFELYYQKDIFYLLNSGNQYLFYVKDPLGQPSANMEFIKLAPHWFYYKGKFL